mgnify:CR=1 FL=1|jgi:hypothetical protein
MEPDTTPVMMSVDAPSRDSEFCELVDSQLLAVADTVAE